MKNEAQRTAPEDRLEAVLRQRRARARAQRRSALITLFAIVLLCGAVVALLSGLFSGGREKPAQGETAAPANDTITIAAVGDIAISDALLADARAGTDYDFAPCFFGVASLLADADVTVGDLECVLAGAPYGTASGSAPEALPETLAGLGFDLLQTANSASIMGGMAGLSSTINAIRAAGMQPVGTFESEKERQACGGVTMVEVDGSRIAFIAFTKGLGNMSLPENCEFAVNCLYSDYDSNYSDLDTDGIAKAMREAKAQKPDLIIALVHWGSEYSREVSKSQERVAELLYENGADAIIGTHSHLVGPVRAETITLEDGGTKDVLTAYDLGNFYTDAAKEGAQTSIALKLTFTRDKLTGKLTLSDWSHTPVYCADFGASVANRYQVLGMEDALALYEQEYFNRVPEQTAEQIRAELDALPGYLAPPEEE